MSKSNINIELEYNSLDGLWKLNVENDKVSVIHKEELREYDLTDIIKVEHDTDYVHLRLYGGEFYQVKFEENSFLVIDKFNKDGEHIDTIGSHVFGE